VRGRSSGAGKVCRQRHFGHHAKSAALWGSTGGGPPFRVAAPFRALHHATSFLAATPRWYSARMNAQSCNICREPLNILEGYALSRGNVLPAFRVCERCGNSLEPVMQ
jgi:hypothetical protein